MQLASTPVMLHLVICLILDHTSPAASISSLCISTAQWCEFASRGFHLYCQQFPCIFCKALRFVTGPFLAVVTGVLTALALRHVLGCLAVVHPKE